jgi:SAM-dependent methyltransferase
MAYGQSSSATWNTEYWNGPAAERWILHQAQVDKALAPFGAAMLEAAQLACGHRVLDVGCGCGATTLLASERVAPGGFVVGIDISRPMIERAKTRAAGRADLVFVEADAAAHVFDAPFDRIISRLGLMFFTDPLQAFRHLRKSLKKGGKLSFTCWRAFEENAWLAEPMAVVTRVLGVRRAPDSATGSGPFAFADRARVVALLEDVGFERIDIAALDGEVELSTTGVDSAVDFVVAHAGPVGRLLSDVSPEQRAAARSALSRELTRAASAANAARIALEGRAWLVTCSAS